MALVLNVSQQPMVRGWVPRVALGKGGKQEVGLMEGIWVLEAWPPKVLLLGLLPSSQEEITVKPKFCLTPHLCS